MLAIQDAATGRSLEQEFHELASQWKLETAHLSRMDKIVLHPAYLKIIGMGREALPWILRELERHVDYWFTALEAITRTSLIERDQPLTMSEATAAWIDWGKRHGYC